MDRAAKFAIFLLLAFLPQSRSGRRQTPAANGARGTETFQRPDRLVAGRRLARRETR